MNKNELLEDMQELSDKAFLQGYKAKEQGIDINDTHKLKGMPEALSRLDCMIKIFNRVMGSNIEL
jgi:hypothetical protein